MTQLLLIVFISSRVWPEGRGTSEYVILDDFNSTRGRLYQKPNSWTYNFFEVSGHNLEFSDSRFPYTMFSLQNCFNQLFIKGEGSKIHCGRWLWIGRRKTFKTIVPITSKNSASGKKFTTMYIYTLCSWLSWGLDCSLPNQHKIVVQLQRLWSHCINIFCKGQHFSKAWTSNHEKNHRTVPVVNSSCYIMPWL